MHPIVKNVIAVIVGFAAGSAVNMGLVITGPYIIPPPEGADMTTMEALAASMPLFEAKHFIFPWLAHALGTLVGALVAYKMAATSKNSMAMIIGVLFLAGGITSMLQLNGPMYFHITDLVVAYIPMAWLGAKFAK